jgi:SAM-dependent methyltransferase
MEIHLAQRGRALMDFEVTARRAASRLHKATEQELAARGVTAETLPDDMDERHAVIDRTLEDSAVYRTRALLGEWCAKNHGEAAVQAFEEVRDDVVPQLAAMAEGPTTIEVLPHFEPPSYYSRVWFHRTHGGWDGPEHNGVVHGEIVHKRYVAKVFPGDIYAARRRVAKEAPRRDYRRILELGTSSGHYTVALSEVFPEAEIWGVDPSELMLEQAQRVGNERGLAWKLFVGLGEDTRFDDESFDLVTSYAIHHEIPPRIHTAWFKEAYRLLKPGGDLIMSDVTRYYDLDKLQAWAFDWVARYQGEPYWRATASLDLADGAREAGFVDVESFAYDAIKTPYVMRARKPG